MGSTIGVPEAMRKKVETFAKAEEIAVTLVSAEAGDVKVAEGAEGEESSVAVLYAGGWIRCPAALALARKLDVGSRDLGKILDLLKIRIRDCSLGCFK